MLRCYHSLQLACALQTSLLGLGTPFPALSRLGALEEGSVAASTLLAGNFTQQLTRWSLRRKWVSFSPEDSCFVDLLHICSLRVLTKKYGSVYFVNPTQPLDTFIDGC